MEKRYLSLSEAADALDISERTAYRWIKSGKLRAYKPGRDYRIPEDAIKEAIEESGTSPKALSRSSLEPSFNDALAEERREAYELQGSLLAERWRRSLQEFKEAPGIQLDTLRVGDCRALLQFVWDVFETVAVYETAAEDAHYSKRPGYVAALREMDSVRQEAADTLRPILDYLKAMQEAKQATDATGAEFRRIWERSDLAALDALEPLMAADAEAR